MPDYDFRGLWAIDFEPLARDVLNADLGLRLQSYAAGRDQGIDLRQVDANGVVTVAQCKHYVESDARTFLRAVAKEGKRGKSLVADRYLFVTSRPLTTLQQDEILKKLSGLPIVHDDIWGQEALNGALGRHSEVERRHIKLWITSTEVLDTLVHSGQWQRGEALLASLADRARLWVQTSAYDEVLDKLQQEGVCIVSGPPGTGKSFLAGMVLLAAARDKWQVVDVANNIEEAWAAIRSERPQIFHYDDFLGEAGVELAKNEPRSLRAFLDRVHQLKDTKRIILTTREQELQTAVEGPADALARLARNPGTYQFRLEAYDLQTRAKILFNHLYFSGLPASEREHLAVDSRLLNITQHPAYNPRIIEDGVRLSPSLTAADILDTIERALANPRDLLNGSFRRLSELCQQILLTMATLPYRPWPAATIRRLVAPGDALAWTPALRALETTWLQVVPTREGRALTFTNPGCREYMLGLLDDNAVAEQQLDRAVSLAQLVSLSRTAGLLPSPGPTPATLRAELASVLTRRRADVLEKLKRFSLEDLSQEPTASRRIRPLRDAATVLAALGVAEDTAWLFECAEALLAPGPDGPAALEPVETFELAGVLANIPAEASVHPERVAAAMALAAANSIIAIRDLDAFEALPAVLSEDSEVAAVAQERARSVIEVEHAQLLDATDNPVAVESLAADLDARAKSYGFTIDIGPILDHAEELAAEPASQPDWPDATDDPDDDGNDAGRDLHALFVQLGDKPVD